jgi:hypothetical protein
MQERQRTYNVTLKRFRITMFAVKKQQYYIFWACGCFLALVIWHVKRMRYIAIYGVFGSPSYF